MATPTPLPLAGAEAARDQDRPPPRSLCSPLPLCPNRARTQQSLAAARARQRTPAAPRSEREEEDAAVYVVHLLKLVREFYVDDLLGWLFATAMLLGPSWLLVFVIAPRTTRSSALLSALVRLDVLLVAEVWDASGRMHDIRTQIRDELLARHSQQPSDTTAAATAGGGGGKKKAEDASILSAPAQRSVVALEPYSSSADPAASPATRTAVSQSAAPSGLLVSKLESGCAASC